MNRRLYFVLPDMETARRVERDLLLARVDDARMHFVGRRGTDFGDLPEATIFQKSDIRHGLFVGFITGSVLGGLLGVILLWYPELIGVAVNPGVILLTTGFGAAFGAATSGFLIGSSTPNVHLKPFERDFEEGRILLMLDLPKDRVEEIRAVILAHFPAAEDHGVDATMPAFP